MNDLHSLDQKLVKISEATKAGARQLEPSLIGRHRSMRYVASRMSLATIIALTLVGGWPSGFAADAPAKPAGDASDPAAALAAVQKAMESAKKPDAPKAEPVKAPAIEYYVALDGQQAGPFACPKLLEMARNHQLTPESRVWRAGFSAWRRADSDRWFDVIFAAVPPPVNGELPKSIEDKTPEFAPCVEKPPPVKEKPWWKPSWWPFE